MYIYNLFLLLLAFMINAKLQYEINETSITIESKVPWMINGEFEISCAAANVGFLTEYFTNPIEVDFTKWSKWSQCDANCTKNRIRECDDENKCGQCEITQEKICSQHENCHPSNIQNGLIRLKFYHDVDAEQRHGVYVQKSKENRKEIKRDNVKSKRIYTKWTNWTSCSRNCLTHRIKHCLVPGKCVPNFITEKAYCYKFVGSRCFKLLKKIRSQLNNRVDRNVSKPTIQTTPRSIVITPPYTTTTQSPQSRRSVTQTARSQNVPSVYSTTVGLTHTPTFQSPSFIPTVFTSSLDPRFTSDHSAYTPVRHTEYSLNPQSSFMSTIGLTNRPNPQTFTPTAQPTQRSTLHSIFTPDFHQKFTPTLQTMHMPGFQVSRPNLQPIQMPRIKPISLPNVGFMPTTQLNHRPTTLINRRPTVETITDVTKPLYTETPSTMSVNHGRRNRTYSNSFAMNSTNLNVYQIPLAVSQPVVSTTTHYTIEQKLRANCGILENERNKKSSMLKIIGGVISKKGRWSWQVALINMQKEFVCGGTLIAPNWILTAAHCVRVGLKARFNEHNLRYIEGLEREYKVERAIVQYNFNKHTVDNDIALLKLPKEVPNKYACLPIQNEVMPVSEMCTIIGWGRTNARDFRGAVVLHETQVPIVSQNECRYAHKRHIITKNMFCAGFRSGGRDTCGGDSGGPLLCRSKEVTNNRIQPWVIYGVTSFGDGCGQKQKYGIYANVVNYVNWIFKIMKKYQ